MLRRPRGFALSWFFAPYLGSADLDFFKRIKGTNVDYELVQVQRDAPAPRILDFTTAATIRRHEVVTDHRNPRTRKTRDDFEREALRVFTANAKRFDFIISHSNEVPSHAVALKCKQRAPHLPWIAYFGDVVSANPYVRHIGHYPLHDEDCVTEAATIEHADLIICNNEWQKRLMFRGTLERFSHKAVVIPHCFDPAMFDAASPPANARFTFMHVGTLYHVKRTAEPLLRAVDRLLEIYPAYRRTFEVVFYGGPYYANDLNTFANLKHRTHVRLEESVPYLESLRMMQSADVLVTIDGVFNAAEDGLAFNPFFPGKLTDYMGAGRPIMGITMAEGPTADILRASGGLVADQRIDRIAYVLKRYLDKKVPHDAASYARYDIQVVAREMESAIHAAIGGERAIRELPARLDAARQLNAQVSPDASPALQPGEYPPAAKARRKAAFPRVGRRGSERS